MAALFKKWLYRVCFFGFSNPGIIKSDGTERSQFYNLWTAFQYYLKMKQNFGINHGTPANKIIIIFIIMVTVLFLSRKS